jgi:hypothetical protein
MGVLANQVVCGIEGVLSLIIALRLLKEFRSVQLSLQLVILCYVGLLFAIIIMAGVGASGNWSLTEMYIIWFFGHVSLSLGVSFRTNAFIQLMAIASSGRLTFNFRAYMVTLFSATGVTNLVVLYFWILGGITSTNSDHLESLHRIGFILFGTWCLLATFALAFFSRFVIKLLEGLSAMKPSPEQSSRLKTLKGATVSSTVSIGAGGFLFFFSGMYSRSPAKRGDPRLPAGSHFWNVRADPIFPAVRGGPRREAVQCGEPGAAGASESGRPGP